MDRSLLVAGVGGLATIVIASLALAPVGRAQTQPMQLLTDTPRYCAELYTEVQATQRSLLEPAPKVVERLAIEGRQLCSLGEVEGGVTRLRRAMVLLHEASGQN
ncbi:MAG: hypothetical protein ACREFO_13000 [Acetobacteraceae bacterium]